MASSTSIQARPILTTLVGTICLSAISIARAGIGQGLNVENRRGGGEECFDAKHYDLVTDFVARMYRGRGIKTSVVKESSNNSDNNNNNNNNNSKIRAVVSGDIGVKLSPTVSFEDPAAVCVNEEEVREAFRALRLINPVTLSPPKCINVEPRGGSINLTFLLNQQYYTLPLYNSRPLNLKSLLIVTVQLQQMQEIPESEFLVTSMKELWYGNPLIQPYLLFYVPRRLNGIISYYLTSRLL
jgi:hypothetical protein